MLEIALAVAALVIAASAFIAPKLKKIKKEGTEDLILAITEDYSRRVSKLEGRIVDLQVRLDILENRFEKELTQRAKPHLTTTEGERFVISQEARGDIIKPRVVLGDFELSILKCIEERAKSPSEVRLVVGRSREHVARALKDLYEAGFLNRRGGRPFIYSLSEKGRAALKGVDLSV